MSWVGARAHAVWVGYTKQCGGSTAISRSCFLLKRALGPVSAVAASGKTCTYHGCMPRWQPPVPVTPAGRSDLGQQKQWGQGPQSSKAILNSSSSELIKGNFIKLESLTNFLFLSPSLLVSLIFSFVAFVNFHQNLPCCSPISSTFPFPP